MNSKKNIVKTGNKAYTEVKLDGMGDGRSYKNPLTRVFQYEYALYMVVSDMFASVKCRSLCIESLMLYFKELSHSHEIGKEINEDTLGEKKPKKTQEGLFAEMTMMVARDVAGHLIFPMMSVCQAEAHVSTNDDGTHTFIFEDGIYAFSVRLDLPKKGNPKRILVTDLGSVNVN